MEHIGSLLRAYIERSGCTIYGIAKKAGCNRTTLQKVLSNDRRPSQELVLSLLPFLRLTPSEQTKLLSLLERQACGDRLYEQRRLIARLLSESSAGISLSSLYPPPPLPYPLLFPLRPRLRYIPPLFRRPGIRRSSRDARPSSSS